MIKNLIKIGNEYGIQIDDHFLESVNADADTLFKLSIANDRIVLQPVRQQPPVK